MSVAPANRRGACPALSAPMVTGDGLLVRLSPVSHSLTPEQLSGLCESAGRHGNGVVEITARGSLQIRGLSAETAPLLADDVNGLGIDVRTGLLVETGPLAGLDPDEVADPRPLAEAISTAIADAGIAARLGPKVSVVVDGGGRFGMASVPADLRVQAALRGGRLLWRLALAGDAGTATSLGATSFQGAIDFVMDLLSDIADLGLEARGQDLCRQDSPRRATSSSVPIGIHPLQGNQTALALALPFGSAPASRLTDFAEAASRLGVEELRLAPGRMLIALCPAPSAADMLREAAGALDLVIEPTDPRLGVSACAGAPACASGHIETRAIAAALAGRQPDLIAAARHVHISGCAKGCAHPAPAAITLVGDENGVGLVVNGTARQKPAAYTRSDTLAESLQRLAGLVNEGGAAGENKAGCLSRIGEDRLASAFRQEV